MENPTPEDWPDEKRIELIGHNGPTGEHYFWELYNKLVEAGVYDA
jgi:hypothetical protein